MRTDFLIDSVWVLPLDAAALLAARTYSAPGKLVVEIVDPDGARARVALDGGPDGATRGRAVECDPRPLVLAGDVGRAARSAATSWATFAAAGAVDEHTPGAVARADAMFATAPAPATVSWF